MNMPATTGDHARAMREAWDWLLRLREEDDRDALARWMTWYESDERNKDAFDEASAIWQQADRVAHVPDPLPRSAWRDAPKPAARMAWRKRTLLSLAAAVVVAIGALLAVSLLPVATIERSPETAPAILASAATPVSPLVRETRLPDGSRVELAANSSVTMEFTDTVRQLTMQSGVAHFTVAHSRARPFVVSVGKLQVRAVGTAFNIRRATDRVVVTVTEGIVDIYERAEGSTPSDRPIRVDAGRELTWAAKAVGPTIASVDPARALAGREGRLDSLNEPLASALADINRYSQRRIIVRDAAVGGIPFSGTVLIGETEEWVRALPRLFPVEVETDADGNIVLTARAS